MPRRRFLLLAALLFAAPAIARADWLSTSPGSRPHAAPGNRPANWAGRQHSAVTVQAGTAYTLADTDCGTTIRFTASSAIAVTAPPTTQPGCAVGIVQVGAGQITVSAGSGASLHSAHSYTKTSAQWAIIGLFVDSNGTGQAADWILTGDGA